MKKIICIVFLLYLGMHALAQDAVIISEGNFERGVIQATNFVTVVMLKDDGALKEYDAKDVESFIWNGDTYQSKPFIFGKKAEVRFFKLLEAGTVNLYAYGQPFIPEQAPGAQTGPLVRPNFDVGLGSGGLGGTVAIDLSRRKKATAMAPRKIKSKVFYFIEKPGTGPMAEISLNAGKLRATKSLLLQKLNNDEDLAERIKATESFDEKNLLAFIKSYNEAHKK